LELAHQIQTVGQSRAFLMQFTHPAESYWKRGVQPALKRVGVSAFEAFKFGFKLAKVRPRPIQFLAVLPAYRFVIYHNYGMRLNFRLWPASSPRRRRQPIEALSRFLSGKLLWIKSLETAHQRAVDAPKWVRTIFERELETVRELQLMEPGKRNR
jgi:hypothetical protein